MFSEIQLVDIQLQYIFLAKILFKFQSQNGLLHLIAQCPFTLRRVFPVLN